MAGTAPVAGRSFLGGTDPTGPPSPAELRSTAPDGDGVPDYDGDGSPGRSLAPTSKPETTTEANEHQLWVGRFTGGVRISGTPKLTIWSSVLGFEGGRGHLRAYLFDCDGAGASCLRQPIAIASLNEPKWSDGSGGFTAKTLTFTSADHVLASGRTLVLRLGVQKGSNPLVIAYGTGDHPAFLAIDVSSSE